MIKNSIRKKHCNLHVTPIIIFFILFIFQIPAHSQGTVMVYEKGNDVIIGNDIAKLIFNMETGRYSGHNMNDGTALFVDAEFGVGFMHWKESDAIYSWEKTSISDELGTGICLTITKKPVEGYKPVQILLIKMYEGKPFSVLGWGIKNNFDYPLRIRHADLLYKGELYSGQKMLNPKVLRGGAGSENNYVESTDKIQALNSMLLTYEDGNKRRSIVAGGMKYKEFIRNIEITDKPGRTRRNPGMEKTFLTLSADDPVGKLVKSSELYISEDNYFLDFVTADPFIALEQFGMAMKLVNEAKPNFYDFPTLCGWIISTSSYGEGRDLNHSAGLIEQLDIAKEKGFLRYSPVAVRVEPDYYCYNNFGNTEQGWWDDEHFTRFGHLRPPYETFKKYCDGVIERGGIPFTYFQSSMPSNDFALAHPEWMLNNDISSIHVTHPHHQPLIRFDYSDPEFQEYMLSVWNRFREDGLKGVKFDYPETAWNSTGGFEDENYTTTSAYRKFFALCREGLGDNAFIHERNLGESNVPRTDATIGIIDLQRVTGDGSDFSIDMITKMGLRWYKNRNNFFYYPDGKTMLDIKTKEPLPKNVRRAILSVHSIISGRLELATSFNSMNDEILYDISRIYPVVTIREAPRPADMFTGKKHPEVYISKISPEWSHLMLLNTDTIRTNVSAPMSGDMAETGSLGLDPEKKYHVFEFWNQNYYGKVSGSDMISADLDPGEIHVYSVRQSVGHPQVISTNRHIMQGVVELEDLNWNAKSGSMSGTAILTADDEMKITFSANGFNHKKTKVKGAKYKFNNHSEDKDLYELTLRANKNQKAGFSVYFQK